MSLSTQLAASFIKTISGVAVSEKEFKRLMKALPSVNKQESVNKSNLKMLVESIENKLETQLNIDFKMFPNEIPSLGEENKPGIVAKAMEYLTSKGY